MSWKSLTAPITVIIIGVIFTIAALSAPMQRAGSGAGNQVPALQQPTHSPADCQTYPNPEFPGIPTDCLALTTTPQRTATATVAGTTTTPSNTTATAGGTATATRTTTATPTGGAITPSTPTVATATRTPPPRQPTADSGQQAAPDDVTPTPANALNCAPGEQVLITGEGPPRAALLLYFGERVVGGGSVPLSGSFSLPLVVGRERAGTYEVTVRVRGSDEVLRELTCLVPPTAPPTPIRIQPS